MAEAVTFAHADLAILQCWKEKVSKGFECSLMLKHSKGRVTTILKSTSSRIEEPETIDMVTVETSSEYRDTNAQNDEATENSSQTKQCGLCNKKFQNSLAFSGHLTYNEGKFKCQT